MGGSTEAVEQAPERGASGRRRGGFRNGLKAVALLLLAQVIGIAIVLAFARDRYPIGPVDVEFHASLAAQGTTTVILPPLGQIDARTHSAPIRLSLLPVVFHARSLDALLGQLSDAQGSLPQVERDARSAVNQFGGRLLLLAFVGGCVGGAFTGTRRARRAFFSGLLCLAIVGGALGATAATYRTRAFTNPKFTGLLTEAPSLFSMLRRGFRQLPQAREQLGLAVRNLAEVYARLETASPSRFERGVR
ncbi:MAG TPA: hypothetical protein VK689_16040, partial [Armatimonadota bacterium]|nr:hypothetical protein [Armatimonadota bacterium]